MLYPNYQWHLVSTCRGQYQHWFSQTDHIVDIETGAETIGPSTSEAKAVALGAGDGGGVSLEDGEGDLEFAKAFG